MARDEIARWIGSIGIFYVLIPAYVVASDPLYAAVLPFLPRLPLPAWTLALFIPAGVAGAALILASIRDQVTHGRGHPFDLTGHERLSRPTQSLLTQGVYYWTRNPMGLGDILLYSALAGVTRSFHSLLINIPR